MADSFNCPNCGAPLDYKGSDPIIRCPFCSSSVIVPDNLRSQPAFSSQQHKFNITAGSDMGSLISQARRFKDIKDLVLAGNESEAIRIYMEITGANADTARTAVESLARGLPIKLSGPMLNMGLSTPPAFNAAAGLNSPIPMTAIPNNNYEPIIVNQKSGGILRTIGCGIGCLTVGMVIFILIVTLVPTAAGLMGVAVSLNPNMVLTMIPAISNVNATPQATTITELTATPEAHKAPTHTPAPTPTAAFANQIFSFGKAGTDPGSFGDVRALAVDPGSGAIFAADYSDGRVMAFDSQGKFISQWTVQSKNPIIQGMAADRKGNIYIANYGSILAYNAQGKLLATIKPVNTTDHYEDVAILSDGSLVVISRGESIIHLSVAGKILNRVDAAISHITGKSELSSKIAVDKTDNVYVLGTFSNSVFIFNPEGKFLKKVGVAGDQPGQLRAPLALGVDSQGRIYISDIKGVQIFSNDGSFNNVLKVKGAVFGMSFDDQGNLYLTTNQETVEKYNIPQ